MTRRGYLSEDYPSTSSNDGGHGPDEVDPQFISIKAQDHGDDESRCVDGIAENQKADHASEFQTKSQGQKAEEDHREPGEDEDLSFLKPPAPNPRNKIIDNIHGKDRARSQEHRVGRGHEGA